MRLLLVSYEFPPKGGTQSQHVAKLALGLAATGCDVTVLTVENPPTPMLDLPLLHEVEERVRIERAWSLEPTRLVQALRALRSGKAASSVPSTGSRGYTSLPRWAVRLVQAFFFPDEKIGWSGRAQALARRLHAETPFDVVLATGPPYTDYVVGRRIALHLRLPWVADLRDPIVGQYFIGGQTGLHRKLLGDLERMVVDTASRVLTATDGMRDELLERYPDKAEKLAVIPNGFDPDDFTDGPSTCGNEFVLSYVGAFQGPVRPDALLRAVAEARRRSKEFAADARVRFVGPRDPETTAAVEEAGLADVVERTGFVPHSEAVSEMMSADVLLFILGEDDRLKLATGSKLPEYLAAGRTVLAVTLEGEAARIVREAGGLVVAPSDHEGITESLLALYAKWREGALPAPAPEVVERFDRRALAGRVSEVLKEAMA